MVTLTFDHLNGVAYLKLREGFAAKTRTFDKCSPDDEIGGFWADIDADGNLLGIEFLRRYPEVWKWAPTATGMTIKRSSHSGAHFADDLSRFVREAASS